MNMFNRNLLASMAEKAENSSKKRQHVNLHLNHSEKCQRLVNAIGRNSYIQPHRHSLDPKIETLIALSGLFALIKFNDNGVVCDVSYFGSQQYIGRSCKAFGIEILPNEWHTVIAMSADSYLFEVKEGPFFSELAKEMAPWAPEEGLPEAHQYFEGLKRHIHNFLS